MESSTSGDGRYRGFDMDYEDETFEDYTSDKDDNCNEDEKAVLQKMIKDQAVIIQEMKLEIKKREEKRRMTLSKKRDEEPIGSSSEGMKIRELMLENQSLKKELEFYKSKKNVCDKNVQTQPRILPVTPTSQNNDSKILERIEERLTKLESFICEKDSTVRSDTVLKTFAAAVTATKPDTVNPVSFRSIMRATQNEEINEHKEKEKRKLNIILHGRESENLANTRDFVTSLFNDVGLGAVRPKEVNVIGKEEHPKRPIIVEFKCEQDKDKIMSNLKKLKGHTSYHGISVTDDYTLAEREIINQYREEAKKLNAEDENEDYYFAVRGSPRTGLSIKKLTKQRKATHMI